MDSKTSEFLTKLVLEDNEDDIVRFAFSNEKRKIKCSISMLSEVSPVFETMFSSLWRNEKAAEVELDFHQEKTITLDDNVNFDQYVAFKLFMQILYGLHRIDSLSVDQASSVYFYSHKYEIKDIEERIQRFLNKRMESGMSQKPFSVTELKDGIEFAQGYQLDEFKDKLDQVKLAFDEENPIKFFDLANKFEMNVLKQQVTDHLKTIEPKEDWAPEVLRAVIECLQKERKEITTNLSNVYCKKCQSYEYFLYCTYCGNSNNKLSTILPNL